MNRLVRSSSGFHWWAWRLCWNVWWWWWVGGSSLSEGLWNVLALLGAERSEHSNIMDIRSTQVNVPYNWVFLCTNSFFLHFYFFQVLNLMTMKVTPNIFVQLIFLQLQRNYCILQQKHQTIQFNIQFNMAISNLTKIKIMKTKNCLR